MTDGRPGSWPEKLDLNDWLELSLGSSSEVDRQIALEELAATGAPAGIRGLTDRLTAIIAKDKSAVCRQLATLVLSLEKARLELKEALKSHEVTPALVKSYIADGDLAKVRLAPSLIRKTPSSQTLQEWRDCLSSEKNPSLIEAGLNVLSRYGNRDDCDVVPMLSLGAAPEIICAGLSLLQQYDVELFKKQVRIGLTSASFQVRLHAVHLLRLIDSTEAFKYLQAFLLHDNALVRQKALRELMLIDFSQVENLFMQFLGRETRPLLLIKAGFVVSFNPAPALPLKIYDILTLANGLKKHIMQLVLKQSIEAVQVAGLLNVSFEEYVAELKLKIADRRSEQLIKCAISDLASSDKYIRIAAVERLREFAARENVKKALERHCVAETADEVKGLIEPLLVDKPVETESSGVLFPDVEKFVLLSLKEQRRILAGLRADDAYLQARQALQALLRADLKKSVVLEILKIFELYGSRIDSPAVTDFLADKDPSVVAQAIKTLGNIDLDVLLPVLNGYLAADDPRVKSAALEVYLKADKEGAVQYLQSVLRSGIVSSRRLGLSLLPLLDYPSAEPVLLKFLAHEPNLELQMQAAYMVAANPTREGVIRLFTLTHKSDGDLKPGFEDIWRVALISAEKGLEWRPEDLENECWEIFKADQERSLQDKNNYSYNSVVGDDDLEITPAAPEDSPVEKLFLHMFEFKWVYLVGMVLLIPVLWFTWNIGGDRPAISTGSGSPGGNIGFIKTTEVSSTSSTQVGSSDWQGTLKTGARELLSSRAYSAALTTSIEERQSFYDNYEKDFRQYMLEVANNPNASEEERMVAAASLNPHFLNGSRAWDAGDFSAAEAYYEQAANDQSLNHYGKLTALQRLMELAEQKQDSTNWIKWQDRLMKELKSMPGNEHIAAFADFGKNFSSLIDLSRSLSTGTSPEAIVEKLKSSGESDESARSSVEALKHMDENFRKYFEKR